MSLKRVKTCWDLTALTDSVSEIDCNPSRKSRSVSSFEVERRSHWKDLGPCVFTSQDDILSDRSQSLSTSPVSGHRLMSPVNLPSGKTSPSQSLRPDLCFQNGYTSNSSQESLDLSTHSVSQDSQVQALALGRSSSQRPPRLSMQESGSDFEEGFGSAVTPPSCTYHSTFAASTVEPKLAPRKTRCQSSITSSLSETHYEWNGNDKSAKSPTVMGQSRKLARTYAMSFDTDSTDGDSVDGEDITIKRARLSAAESFKPRSRVQSESATLLLSSKPSFFNLL